jgi:hypothetical protein
MVLIGLTSMASSAAFFFASALAFSSCRAFRFASCSIDSIDTPGRHGSS